MIHEERLKDVHKDLVKLVKELDQFVNIVVLEGYRDKEKQDLYYNSGKSKVKYPHSKHNIKPALAVDIAVYPIDWRKTKVWYVLYGLALAIAKQLDIRIRWGGDWDRDLKLYDQNFLDLVHFELIGVGNEKKVE